MIASKIGRTFLNAYNQKYDKEYSAKEFFEEVYWEIFYNHPKYLFWPKDSEFVQGVKTLINRKIGKDIKIDGKVIKFESKEKANVFLNKNKLSESEEFEIRKVKNKKEFVIVKTLDTVQKIELLLSFYSKIKRQLTNQNFDYSVIFGFPASSENKFAVTSGLVTDINLEVTEDDVYYSWIGGALGVGVGGSSILFDNPDVLLATFEGWKKYRELLNNESLNKLAGNKIDSWNGQWLNFYFDEYYFDNPDFSTLSDEGFFSEGKGQDKGVVVIETIKWSRLFFNLSRKLPNNTLIGYVYFLGKTNKTIGFIPFKLNQARSLVKNYKNLFGEYYNTNYKEIESLFGLSIKNACKLGSIGFQSLQPSDLFEDINGMFKEKKHTDINKLIYNTYKTWLITMINKEDTLEMTNTVAQLLHLFVDGSKGTDRKNLVNTKLLQSNKRNFLIYWYEIVDSSKPEERDKLKKVSDKVFKMTIEEFGYFLPLLKLDYKYQETN